MINDIKKIKELLTKEIITHKEIKESLTLIENILANKPSIPEIWRKARKTPCVTQFVEWYFINILKMFK